MAANKSLPGGGWPALRQSQRVVLRSAVGAAVGDLREAWQAIEEDRQALERLLRADPEQWKAWACLGAVEGGECAAGTGAPTLHLFLPTAWRASCPSAADCLEAHGLFSEAAEARRLVASAPLQRPHDAERLPAWRRAYAEAVKGLIGLLEPLARDLAAADGTSPEEPAGQTHDQVPPERQVIPTAESKRVKLFGPAGKPLVDGKLTPVLTTAQYDVVLALIQAGERGLTKDELDRKSKHGDARKIMRRLADKDSDWKDVLLLAGKIGGRYRIA